MLLRRRQAGQRAPRQPASTLFPARSRLVSASVECVEMLEEALYESWGFTACSSDYGQSYVTHRFRVGFMMESEQASYLIMSHNGTLLGPCDGV